MATQNERIMLYLNQHGSITVRDAFEYLFINSPTKRFSELRKKGFITESTKIVWGCNEKGTKVMRTHYSIYTLTDTGKAAAATIKNARPC